MAILQGFPPSNTISPSVRIAEKDLSFIAPEQSFHRAGLVGFASKGPINSPTMINTARQLSLVFGFPHPDVGDPYLIYAGLLYLQTGSELYVVRVADVDPVSDEQATTASCPAPAAGDTIDIFTATAGPYYFDGMHGTTPHDYFFRWRLNGVLSAKTLVVLNIANRPAPNTNQAWSVTDLVNDLNSQLDLIHDGIMFYVRQYGAQQYLGVKTTWAYGPTSSLELVAVQDAMYGGSTPSATPPGNNVSGLGVGMTAGSTTGANQKFPVNGYQAAGTFDFSGLTGLNLQIVVDGTDNVLIDQIMQTVDMASLEGGPQSIGTIVTQLNDYVANNLPGGFVFSATGDQLTVSTLSTGVDARLLVKSSSTANDIFGFDNLTAVGVSPIMVTGDTGIEQAGIVDGAPNTTGIASFTITADSPGLDGNLTSVVVTNNTRDGTFNMSVYNNGVPLEAWGNLTKDSSSTFYVETFLALVSDFIRVQDNVSVGAPPADSGLAGYQLTGGSDGIPSDPDLQDTLLIGSPYAFTGMYALSEPEQVDIDLLACPGHASTAVVTSLLDVCQNYRMDSLAIIDPPFGLTVNEIIAWQNGTHPLNLSRFDSDFGALYWPWVKINDSYNRVDVWVPPSGGVLAAIARSDFLSAPWFAPAGVTRGVVPGVTDVFNRPTLAERDLMYGNRNAINPIIQFVDIDGFLIWGQKTLQRQPTALDRVNVRRCMFVCEKKIRAASRIMLFDPNDDIFRSTFTTMADNILKEIKVGRGLYDYIILADTTINTPDVIDRNEFRARIGIQPTRAAEFMFIEFSIHRTGDWTSAGAPTFN
jgi:hypothetical protein